MEKQFVPLTSNQSPSKNPYKICTYMGEFQKLPHREWHTDYCTYQRDCGHFQNPHTKKVITLQDQIHKIQKRTQENIFLRNFSKKCRNNNEFTTCVVPQRTPGQLRLHEIMLENSLKVEHEMSERAHNLGNLYSTHKSIIELNDPPFYEEDVESKTSMNGYIIPELASPECSREVIYVPPKRLLDLKRPKSGIYVNETDRPKFHPEDGIPYSTYNPRLLQKQFDAQSCKNIDLIPCNDTKRMWTWNVGLQKEQADLDRIYIEASVPKFECNNVELAVYKIPEDLDKTFTARITLGTKAVPPKPSPRRKTHYWRPLEIACLYVAFVEGFYLNADFWTFETLDNIIKMARKLVDKCTQLNYKSPDNDYDIIPQIHDRQAALNIKVHFAGPLKSEPNIYKALSIYFSKYNACLLCSNNLYLLIWKRCKNLFYIYDPNGRNENCVRDFEKGRCALLSTHYVEHLVHFIVNISQTSLEEEFKQYEIFLTSYGKTLDPLPKKPFPKTFRKQWAVVNESYAVIPGCVNGIDQPATSTVDNASMLISLMAILYSHIERGNSWKPDQVDELVRLGTGYYKSLRRNLNLGEAQHVIIVDLPDQYVLGTFKASIKKYPFIYTGAVTDFCKKFTDSLLTNGMQELFDDNWDAALLQIDNSVLGIWRDRELFYIYDPFRRGRAGQVLDPDDYRTKGTAILQMHANIESLLKMLYESSLKIRRGAKFFIHAINVGCIKPIMDGKQRKVRYSKLKLTPETYVQPVVNEGQGDVLKEDEVEKDETNKKKSKLAKVCSIKTLDENERAVELKTFEIVEPVVDQILCDIVENLPDEVIARPKLYESAARVLLHSDKEYLENLKYFVQRDEDYDNIEMLYKVEPKENAAMISLEEELKLPNNFESLPDGIWIIFGSQPVNRTNEEQFKLTGLLSIIVTAALTAKYKISTWTNKLIDYALESANNFGDSFQTYQYTLGALLNKRIPKLLLGNTTFEVDVQETIQSNIQKSLRQVLIETLIHYNRLMVICQRFSCLIVKRLNFLYMFCGFPVNSVGYRKYSPGPGCMMRFVELDSLLRRIEFGCNPQHCDATNYVVVPLKVRDLTLEAMGRYRSWPKRLEQQMYNKALDEKTRIENSKKSKLRFLAEELAKEDRRIRYFEEKRAKRTRSKVSQSKSSIGTSIEGVRSDIEDEPFSGGIEHGDEDCVVAAKHSFSHETEALKPKEDVWPRPIVYGYRMREKDLLFKIQGSKALEDRKICVDDKIKPCLFSSALAILYAILKPLNEWTSYRVDQVIDSTLLISDKIKDMSIVPERTLRNIAVDDYIFDIVIKVHQPLGLIGKKLETQLDRVLSQNKYIIFKTANCSYAMIKNEFYDLFDPYGSMTLMNSNSKTQNLKGKYLKSLKRFRERNTASWILFADIKSMIQYINERACTRTWKEKREYTFMALETVSYKKAPQSTFMLQLLTDMQSCDTTDETETAICAHNESIAWLEHCLPIWSRLNRRNAAGRYRGWSISKFKNYDIEIEDRLWSLWGNLHPMAPVFDTTTRGKQYLACCIVALCATCIYRLVDWSSHFLDSIVISGDSYLKQSLQTIECKDYQLTLEDLDTQCMLDNIKFGVHIEIVSHGQLYARPYYNRMNLAEALMHFFNNFQLGILQSLKKCLAIGFIPGHDGGYFMFDCQSCDNPLFSNGQGSSYILRTKYLQILLYCIVVTLNIPYYNVQFALHKVDVQVESNK